MSTPLDSLMGKRGDPPMCRVVSDKVAIHWFPTFEVGVRCFCGKTVKHADEDVAIEKPDYEDPAS